MIERSRAPELIQTYVDASLRPLRPPTVALAAKRRDVVRSKRLRRRARLSIPSARARTKIVEVSHPTVAGHTERVHRVVNGLEAMYRAKLFGREPLAARRRYEAAVIWRGAWDRISSSVGGAMDFDRIRGPSLPGEAPAVPYLMAAERLREARGAMYAADHRIATLVLGEGYTVADVARMIHGSPIKKVKVEEVGTRLRAGLDELADLWFGTEQPNTKSSLRVWPPRAVIRRESSSRSSSVGEFIPTRVAHATRMGVKITGG